VVSRYDQKLGLLHPCDEKFVTVSMFYSLLHHHEAMIIHLFEVFEDSS
jgi:hypothetical protein